MLILGECVEKMRELPDASIAAVVTDPPYGISFMGKHWDRFDIEQRVGKRDVSKLGTRLSGDLDRPDARKPTARTASAFANAAGEAGGYDFSLKGNRAFQAWVEEVGRELLRVLNPGGYAVVFGGTRTYHRLASGLEDAGFEIRDTLAWMFGQGFPKSLDVSKQLDKSAGHWRGKAGEVTSANGSMSGANYERTEKGEPVTAAAAAAAGWGTALKPAFEPIVLARKPFSGSVAANFVEHGTGALNIDACRIEGAKGDGNWSGRDLGESAWFIADQRDEEPGAANELGRWPANVLLDDEAARILDEQTGELASGANPTRRGSDKFRGVYGDFAGQQECEPARGADVGGASRFFYCAKVSTAERHAGLPDGTENDHPTVKPLDLMRWLCRLVTPPGGTVLDPFLGSGTTGCAAALEGFDFVGIDQDVHYLHHIAAHRIAFWDEHGDAGLDIVRARDAADRVRQEIADAGQLDLLAEGAA